jgi:uncharacterized phage protein gp47/JayE
MIAARMAAAAAADFAGVAPDEVDASSANAPLAVVYGAPAQALYAQRLAIAAQVDDFFVDLCRVDLVPTHAARWGLAQAPAQAAGGFANPPAGSTGGPIPADATLGGGLYRVATSGAIDGTGTESIAIVAVTPGVAGNLTAGTVLELDSPVAGLAAQQLTVDADGLTGGSPQETLEQLRARTVATLRRRGKGGGPGDYVTWVQNLYPQAIVRELPLWTGLGTAGVAVAFAGRTASGTEVSRIQATLAAAAPVTVVTITVVAATITAVPLTLALSPDNTATRAAVTSAFAAFMAAEPGIAGLLELSRLDAALSSAAGEYAHRRSLPAANIQAGATELLVPGAITWSSWT